MVGVCLLNMSKLKLWGLKSNKEGRKKKGGTFYMYSKR